MNLSNEVNKVNNMANLCEACEVRVATIVEDEDDPTQPYHLCAECHHRLLTLSLRPLEYYNLAKRHGLYKYYLHDDFYDEDGTADQPEEDVIDADAFPAPALGDVTHDLDALLDFTITRWWFNSKFTDIWREYPSDDVSAVLYKRFDEVDNLYIHLRILEIAAWSLGQHGAELVRHAWQTSSDAIGLGSWALASAKCLPFDEGFQLILSVLESMPANEMLDKKSVLGYFHSPVVLDWIEANIREPISESWGRLAAGSNLDWQRVVDWFESGRPLSLVAIDALQTVVSPPSVQRGYVPQIQGVPDEETVRKVLKKYKVKDCVPRVRKRIDAILDKIDVLMSDAG